MSLPELNQTIPELVQAFDKIQKLLKHDIKVANHIPAKSTKNDSTATTPCFGSFEQEYLGNFEEATASKKQLRCYAELYQELTEAYDQIVCTGEMKHSAIMPADGRQLGIISRHATELRKELWLLVRPLSFSYRQWLDAIRVAGHRGRIHDQNAERWHTHQHPKSMNNNNTKIQQDTGGDCPSAPCCVSSESLPTPHPSGAWDRSDYVREYAKLKRELEAKDSSTELRTES